MSDPFEVIFVSLRSLDLKNLVFQVQKIWFEIFNHFGHYMSFYVFVRAPAGPDPRRAPGGPRAPAGLHQVPGEGPREGPGEGPEPRGEPRGGPH